MGKLKISFGGLIAYNLEKIDKGGDGQAILMSGLNPDDPKALHTMQHLPRLMFDPRDVDRGASSVSVGSILRPNGKVLGYVDLTGREVSIEGGSGGGLTRRRGPRTLARAGSDRHYEDREPHSSNKEDFDWVPKMELIVAEPKLCTTHTTGSISATTLVASRIKLTEGELAADKRSHKRDNSVWNIPNDLEKVYEQYVADFVTLTMRVSGPVKFHFSDLGYLAFGKSSPKVAITCFPESGELRTPNALRSAYHFARYFDLLAKPLKSPPVVPRELRAHSLGGYEPEGVFPVKCMPTQFP